jgi:hypothetical protein
VPPGGKVFLALGTIENMRQAALAVPDKALIGRNLMAHLRSNLTFRVPHNAFPALNPDNEPDPVKKQRLRELQISALFVKGIHTHADGSKGHYHIQITSSGVGELGMNSDAELFKKIPNIDDLDQFQDLTDKWIVITLRGIGEMVGDKTSANPQNRVTLASAGRQRGAACARAAGKRTGPIPTTPASPIPATSSGPRTTTSGWPWTTRAVSWPPSSRRAVPSSICVASERSGQGWLADGPAGIRPLPRLAQHHAPRVRHTVDGRAA